MRFISEIYPDLPLSRISCGRLSRGRLPDYAHDIGAHLFVPERLYRRAQPACTFSHTNQPYIRHLGHRRVIWYGVCTSIVCEAAITARLDAMCGSFPRSEALAFFSQQLWTMECTASVRTSSRAANEVLAFSQRKGLLVGEQSAYVPTARFPHFLLVAP